MAGMIRVAVRALGLACAVGLLMWMGGGCQKRQSALNSQVAQVRTLLSEDCGVGEPAAALPDSQIRAIGASALPELWSALRFGPTAAERDTIEESARQEYGRIQAFLAGGGLSGITPSAIRDSVQAVTDSQYVDMQLTSFILGYQQRALNAVVDLDPAELEDSLTAIVTEPTLPPLIQAKIDKILNP